MSMKTEKEKTEEKQSKQQKEHQQKLLIELEKELAKLLTIAKELCKSAEHDLCPSALEELQQKQQDQVGKVKDLMHLVGSHKSKALLETDSPLAEQINSHLEEFSSLNHEYIETLRKTYGLIDFRL